VRTGAVDEGSQSERLTEAVSSVASAKAEDVTSIANRDQALA
jgi:hypothetical protein